MTAKCKPTNLDGAILTPEAIKEIASLQEFNNCFIDERIKELTDMVFWLVEYISSYPDDTKLINRFLSLIGEQRTTLLLLKSPKELKGES